MRKVLKAIALSPVIARPGYWFATLIGALWGIPLSLGRARIIKGMLVCRKMPRWSFGRGGTMIGAVFLTHSALSEPVLRHEKVHQQQWKKYGLLFPLLYFRAGVNPLENRFEIEAGLEDAGYTRRGGGAPKSAVSGDTTAKNKAVPRLTVEPPGEADTGSAGGLNTSPSDSADS